MLRKISDVTDGHIDGAIDLVELIAAGLRLDSFDQAEELRGMEWAPRSALPATIQHCAFFHNVGRHAAPLPPQCSLRGAKGEKSKWLVAHGQRHFRCRESIAGDISWCQ